MMSASNQKGHKPHNNHKFVKNGLKPGNTARTPSESLNLIEHMFRKKENINCFSIKTLELLKYLDY